MSPWSEAIAKLLTKIIKPFIPEWILSRGSGYQTHHRRWNWIRIHIRWLARIPFNDTYQYNQQTFNTRVDLLFCAVDPDHRHRNLIRIHNNTRWLNRINANDTNIIRFYQSGSCVADPDTGPIIVVGTGSGYITIDMDTYQSYQWYIKPSITVILDRSVKPRNQL